MEPTTIPEDRWETPRPGERLFTFGLVYRFGPSDDIEEIDLYARTDTEAWTRIKLVADLDYDPGYEKIISMAPGGSAGLVQVWSL